MRMSAPRKIYAYDTGMVNAVRFRTGSDNGRLLENLVAVELYRRGTEYYSFKSSGGKEVDFLLRSPAGESSLIQVCYDLSDPKTRRRELQALVAAGDELGLSDGTVLTWDEEGVETVANFTIYLTPTWKWLLRLESK